MTKKVSDPVLLESNKFGVLQFRPGKYVLLRNGRVIRRLSKSELIRLDEILLVSEEDQEPIVIEKSSQTAASANVSLQLVDPGMIQVALAITVIGYVFGDNATSNSTYKLASNWIFLGSASITFALFLAYIVEWTDAHSKAFADTNTSVWFVPKSVFALLILAAYSSLSGAILVAVGLAFPFVPKEMIFMAVFLAMLFLSRPLFRQYKRIMKQSKRA